MDSQVRNDGVEVRTEVRDLAWYKERLKWTNIALALAIVLGAWGWIRYAVW